MWLLEGPRGASQNFLGSLSLNIFYIFFINYAVIRPLQFTSEFNRDKNYEYKQRFAEVIETIEVVYFSRHGVYISDNNLPIS